MLGYNLVKVTDLTAPERTVVCDIASMGPLLAGWWAELGLSTAVMGSHARALIKAAKGNQWAAVHAIAEHVSLDVVAVRSRGNVAAYDPDITLARR